MLRRGQRRDPLLESARLAETCTGHDAGDSDQRRTGMAMCLSFDSGIAGNR
jgi:hypothetical protein